MKTQKFSYLFTPAGITSNFVPLIVILYGQEDINLEDFEYKMWNVLQICSLDKDIKEEKLLKELIVEISETHECEEYIFMYGEIQGLKDAITLGVCSEKNSVQMPASQMTQKENLKQVLDEFERMEPVL